MNAITHVAPQLPPAMDGVGDYCWNLCRHWPEPQPAMKFLALYGAEQTRQHWRGAEVRGFETNAQSLLHELEAVNAGTVVLHYVSYGFQPKGLPTWLVDGLEEWRRRKALSTKQRPPVPSRRLITMFHEMYATSSPLRSPFWVKPWARQIIRRLVRASDLWVTSCDRYFDWLVTEFGAEPERGKCIPIGSNVPAAMAPHPRLRPNARLRLVLFGLPNTRLWALERHHRVMRALVQADMAGSILLLGRSNDSAKQARRLAEFQRGIGGEWQAAFDLPPEDVAEKLAQCDIGFVANEPGILTKSGVFAALAANGVVCVVSNREGGSPRVPFRQCVLLNDDDPRHFGPLLSQLRDGAALTQMRESALSVSRTALAWEQIASEWQAHLLPFETEPEPRHDRAGGSFSTPTMANQEVRR